MVGNWNKKINNDKIRYNASTNLQENTKYFYEHNMYIFILM